MIDGKTNEHIMILLIEVLLVMAVLSGNCVFQKVSKTLVASRSCFASIICKRLI